jgi:hypothetical protein
LTSDLSRPDHGAVARVDGVEQRGARAASRLTDVDEPLFDLGVIPNAGDQRSVGELLRDVDYLARELLLDVTGDDAAGLLRGWPDVVEAATRLWNALPGRPLAVDSCEDLDRPMAKLGAMGGGIDKALRARTWPGAGSVDDRALRVTATIDQAAGLVQRYGAEVAAERGDVRRDIQAARTRLMHGVYLTAHAIGVALHQRGRDLRRDAAEAGRPIPISRTLSPYSVNSTARWLQQVGACERTAGDYLAGRFPNHVNGETDAPLDDPARLRRALASWDISAHRALATRPTSASLALVAGIQAHITGSTLILLHAGDTERPPSFPRDMHRLASTMEEANRAWNELGTRWRELSSPTARLDPTLAVAAAEIRSAFAVFTHAPTVLVPSNEIARRPGLHLAVQASLEALDLAAELALVISDAADDPDLTGPARALSRRAHNDIDAAIVAGVQPDGDTLWVTPQDVLVNRQVPLPAPVAEGLRVSSAAVVDLSQTAVAAAASLPITNQETTVGAARPTPLWPPLSPLTVATPPTR